MSLPASAPPPYDVHTTLQATTFVLPRRKRSPLATAVACAYLAIAAAIVIALVAALLHWGWWILREIKLGLFALVYIAALVTGAFRRLFPRQDTLVLRSDGTTLLNTGSGRPSAVDLTDVVRLELECPHSLLVPLGLRHTRLLAEHCEGKRTTIVSDYPPDLLRRLAADIAPALRSAAPPSDDEHSSLPRPVADVVDVSTVPLVERDVLEMPAACAIRYLPADNAHTFILPRWGFIRSLAGLVAFLFAMAIYILLPTLLSIALIQRLGPNQPPFERWLIAISFLLILTGLWGTLAGIHLYFRKTVIVVALHDSGEPELSWMTRGLLGKRERHWPRNELRGVTTAKRGVGNSFKISSADDTPVALYALPHRGRRKLLADGKELDIRWLATRIRQFLELPKP